MRIHGFQTSQSTEGEAHARRGEGLMGGTGSQVLGLLPGSKGEDAIEVRPRKAETGHPVLLLGQSCLTEL